MYILYVFMKSIPSSVSYKNEILDEFIPRNGYLYVQSRNPNIRGFCLARIWIC